MLTLKDTLTVSLILFSVIDILGALPVIINLRKKTGSIDSGKATFVAGGIMVAFLFLGSNILKLLGVDVESFALAGAIVIFLMGLEMVLDRNIFRADPSAEVDYSHTIVPLAFPLIAGAGTITTILSLRAQYQVPDILAGITINLVFVYLVLRSSAWIEAKIGRAGSNILRKVFGVILLAIAIKLVKSYFTLPVPGSV